MRSCAIALALATVACGGTIPATAGAGSDGLQGAWWTHVAPDGDPLPCPLELEVFADGSAEVNHLSEGGPAKACSFARVPVVRDGGVVRFAGQLSACRWRREGARLRLACEDHGEPPASFETSLLLERRVLRERHGQEALTGSWQTPAFWGTDALMVVGRDGSMTLAERQGHLVVRDDETLEMGLAGRLLPCRYRVIDDRLSLRCAPQPGQPPPPLGASRSTIETLVFRRAGARPPEEGATVPAIAAHPDADGDDIGTAVDQCPNDPEDFDGFDDRDGCPELDNDRDGVLDQQDLCPTVAEDADGDTDQDGCPDASTAP